MPARIREAVASDAPSIARVHVDAWRTSYRGLMPDILLDRLDYDERTAHWSHTLRDPTSNAATFVAEREGDVIGFSSGGRERSGSPDYHGELYVVYVRAEEQRMGVGRLLFDAVASWLQQVGHDSMLLWVLEQNPSRQFYEKLGGRIVGKKEERFGEATLTEIAYGFDLRKITGRGSGRSTPS